MMLMLMLLCFWSHLRTYMRRFHNAFRFSGRRHFAAVRRRHDVGSLKATTVEGCESSRRVQGTRRGESVQSQYTKPPSVSSALPPRFLRPRIPGVLRSTSLAPKSFCFSPYWANELLGLHSWDDPFSHGSNQLHLPLGQTPPIHITSFLAQASWLITSVKMFEPKTPPHSNAS